MSARSVRAALGDLRAAVEASKVDRVRVHLEELEAALGAEGAGPGEAVAPKRLGDEARPEATIAAEEARREGSRSADSALRAPPETSTPKGEKDGQPETPVPTTITAAPDAATAETTPHLPTPKPTPSQPPPPRPPTKKTTPRRYPTPQN